MTIIAIVEALVRRHWEYTVALYEVAETTTLEELGIRKPEKAKVFLTKRAAKNYAATLSFDNPEVAVIEYNRRKVK